MWPHRAHCISLFFCSICLLPPSFDLLVWGGAGASKRTFTPGTIRCPDQEVLLRFSPGLLSLPRVEPPSLSCQQPCAARSFDGSTSQSHIQGFPLPSTTTFNGRDPLDLSFTETSLGFFLLGPNLLIWSFTFALVLAHWKWKRGAEGFPEKFFCEIRIS